MGKELRLLSQDLPLLGFLLIGIVLTVGLLAGVYPAFIVSSYRPIKGLGKTLQSGPRGLLFRRILVILQFGITVIFIIGTLTVRRQIKHMKNQSLGFDGAQTLVIAPVSHWPTYSQLETFRNELESGPGIERTCLSSVVPGRMYWQDLWSRVGDPNQRISAMKEIQTDFSFIDLYDLEMAAGRPFQETMGTDRGRDFSRSMDDGHGTFSNEEWDQMRGIKQMAVVLNESAVNQLGFDSPQAALEAVLVRDPVSVDFHGHVVGVVKDFHMESLRDKIQPLVMYLLDTNTRAPMQVSVRMSGQELSNSVRDIESLWMSRFPETEFESFFVNEAFDGLYQQEEKIFDVYGYVSLMSIFIACLGLLGLILFALEQRNKEIGVRKVLGASVLDIFRMFSIDYVRLILAANLVAWPVSYILMLRWLQGFAYRTSLDLWIFVFTAFSVFTVTMLTVGLQVIRAARANPVEVIRDE
jgi:putative ABC transport system permease protein